MATALASLPLFAEREARDQGMDAAAACRNALVGQVRSFLAGVARGRSNRCVTIDDAEAHLKFLGKSSADLGNAAGVVFRHPDWEFTGVTTPSTRKGSHARHVRVWRLK